MAATDDCRRVRGLVGWMDGVDGYGRGDRLPFRSIRMSMSMIYPIPSHSLLLASSACCQASFSAGPKSGGDVVAAVTQKSTYESMPEWARWSIVSDDRYQDDMRMSYCR